MKAILIKRTTEDGVEFIRDEVPIGKIYEVDEKEIKMLKWLDKRTDKITERKCILVISSHTKGAGGEERPGYLPLELLNLAAD